MIRTAAGLSSQKVIIFTLNLGEHVLIGFGFDVERKDE
jgi:hypothetical protein